MLSVPGFQLKGNGWYATDFKGGAKPTEAASEAAAPASTPCGGNCACQSGFLVAAPWDDLPTTGRGRIPVGRPMSLTSGAMARPAGLKLGNTCRLGSRTGTAKRVGVVFSGVEGGSIMARKRSIAAI